MESLISTVCGSEFQTEGAKKRKARLEKSVLVNGWASSGMADERKVRLQIRFRDSVVQLNRSGRGPNVVRQNCQLVCDPLLDWQQPMQLVLPPSLPPSFTFSSLPLLYPSRTPLPLTPATGFGV